MAETSVNDTVEILSQSNSVIYGCDDDPMMKKGDISLESIYDLLTQINTRLRSIEVNNVSLENRMATIENKMSNFKEISDSISALNHKINNYDSQIKDLVQTVTTIEHNAKAMSDIFDDVKVNTEHELKAMRTETKRISDDRSKLDKKVTENTTELHRNQLEIQKSVIDLKSRSMRDNLVFSGIPESRGEVCEDTLRDFLKNKLKILDEIPFERVHRVGKPNEFNTRPRNIDAKFSFFKDRELVRKRAPLKLKGSNIWVNEQFPQEVEEKRRILVIPVDATG